MLTYGSLFAGIGGFDLALDKVGMKCLWQVEIDKDCQKVLKRHWPNVRRYSDVKEVGKHNLEPVDLVCGGFPCQDLSVAGKREGLDGERSGLWFEFHRILEEIKPRWVIVENVPGLLSSNEGRDFAIVLSGLADIGYLSAWRVLDAQYFRVAQRRRRVFVVGNLGNGSAAEVLFESEGGAWDSPPSREAGARLATDVAASLRSRGKGTGTRIDAETGLVAATLNSGGNSGGFRTEPGEHLIAFTPAGFASYCDGPGTLRASGGDCGNGSEILIAGTLTADYGKQGGNGMGGMEGGIIAFRTNQTNAQGPIWSEGVTDSLAQDHPPAVIDRIDRWVDEPDRIRAIQGDGHSSTAQEHIYYKPNAVVNSVEHARPPKLITYGIQQDATDKIGEDVMPTLRGKSNGGTRLNAVYYSHDYNQDRIYDADGIAPTHAAADSNQTRNFLTGFGVRRLMPVECERLQSYPDGHTAGQSDSVRYRQCGNGVCSNVAEWLGKRIMRVEGLGYCRTHGVFELDAEEGNCPSCLAIGADWCAGAYG